MRKEAFRASSCPSPCLSPLQQILPLQHDHFSTVLRHKLSGCSFFFDPSTLLRLCCHHDSQRSSRDSYCGKQQANYSIKQRVQTIFGTALSSSLTEFGSSFVLPRRVSQDVSLSDSLLSIADSEERAQQTPQRDDERLQFSFSTLCDWNHVLLDDSVNELHGFVTGFVTRVGSSNNSSDRGNQNLSVRGNASKQLLFVNGRLIEYRKVDILVMWRADHQRVGPSVERVRATNTSCDDH